MRSSLTISVVLLASVTGLGAQDRLTAAKDLYASAAYEDALSALSSMDADSTAPDISRQANEYRAFCLYALGRTTEAESVAEAMTRRIGVKPVWLSTAGAGVSWLHVRLDDRPKYYGFGPYRR